MLVSSVNRRCLSSITFKNSSHNNVKVNLAPEITAEGFYCDMIKAMDEWRVASRTAVWIDFNENQLDLIPTAIKLGFSFHNAIDTRATMVHWLPKDILNKVPKFGFHQVGVGGFVLNKNNELLLIKERHMKVNRWKLPGGLVDPGESLAQGVSREVFEETGIQTSFESILGFYQRTLNDHLSDIYFIAKLRADSLEITLDPLEVSDCKWEPLSTYDMDHPLLKIVVEGYISKNLTEMNLHPVQGANNLSLDSYFPLLKT